MLVLPTGQIFFADFSKDVEIYTPTDQLPDPSWAPANLIVNDQGCPSPSSVDYWIVLCDPIPIHNSTGNTLSGRQLNGMSQGAAYGHDYQDATNYPLVRITGFWGQTYYCRTYGHSSMGVATGNLRVSTNFDCPNVPDGFFGSLEVVTNGIAASIPVSVGP